MNTFEIGDNFEAKSYDLIQKAIDNDELGISPKYSKVYRKKGYYSSLREKEIIFDLSIEVWPPAADRFSILYVIECKDYSTKSVPVDDVEEFLFKISQISNLGYYVKAGFISSSSFQEGALVIGRNAHMLMIEVDNDGFVYRLHRQERSTAPVNPVEAEADIILERFLIDVFNLTVVKGLKQLSKKGISQITEAILMDISPDIQKRALRIDINQLTDYFSNKHGLSFNFLSEMHDNRGHKVFGYYDVHNKIIFIDRSLILSDRFPFLLAHELGHFTLHSELHINQTLYDNFRDSVYDVKEDKHILRNYKNWIEWQANQFGASLIVPADSLMIRLDACQKALGISKRGHIYLDHQPVNVRDYIAIKNYLAQHFNTTITTIEYRLQDLGMITYATTSYRIQDQLTNLFEDF